MRIAYLLLADSANQSADGKLNALGLGIRVVNAAQLPVSLSMSVLASAEMPIEERGPKRIRLTLEAPAGEETLVDDVAEMAARDEVLPDLPLQLNLQFALTGLEFKAAGPHRVVLEVDGARAEYPLLVLAPTAPTRGG